MIKQVQQPILKGLKSLFLTGCVCMAVSLPVNVHAADVPTACDPEYMDALEARAWMEAQREISQNKNLIFRPDSVLAYTCFDKIVGTVVKSGPDSQPFSEEPTPWGDIENRSAGTTKQHLEGVVLAAMKSYMTGQKFEGGDAGYLNNRGGGSYTTATSASTSYSCSTMQSVWKEARNLDFMSNPGTDGFFDFPKYQGSDPRQLPAWAGPKTPPTEWAEKMRISYNGDQGKFTMSENPNDTTPYKEDPVVTHLEKILPVGTAPANSCAGPIATGVKIDRNGDGDTTDTNEGDEKVCPNPGCYYNGSSCSQG